MNILEEIQNCPVEWKELWEVTIWDKNFNSVPTYKQLETDKYEYRLAKELSQMVSENGDVKILTTSPSDLWTSEYIASWEFYEKEIIAIPWGGNPVVQYYKGKFITGDNRIARVKNSSELSTKFLYYYLMNKLQIISSFYRGSGIKHPDMSKVLDLKIPVPPLEIQEKIVQILDKMTEYVTELTTELTSRKKQYSYYRDKLLSFEDEVYQVEWKTLGDIGKVSMCRRILKNQTSDDGEIPFYKIGTFGRVATSYISRELFEDYKLRFSYPKLGDILISASGTIGRTVVFNGEDSYFQDSNIVWLDHDESQVLNRYLYYFYQINPWNVSDGGTISRLYNGNIEKTRIPVPSLEIQSRIVQVLDNFDMVCHDLNIGLPKETELRQKQYEYFREKLLTFTAEGEYTDSTVQYSTVQYSTDKT
ncbi:restriction endonuclease subunit S [Streptococcus sanguinis]|uniref:restriction endonuclease subunit S n=1 Tax=Streptococcus sanguinis TaxID=1305 RepID=UPI0022DEEDD3|nr:restriction endonuclease subunit S [Streptococcus sanguinis]